ncbi:MAG: hypothetical protein ACOZJZ_10350 [Pseudomonadota bacterium]
MSLTIEYRLAGSGWADCAIQLEGRTCQISASYLSDALGNLILAAAAVVAGVHSVSVGFDEEPGEYRWAVVKSGGNEVNVRLLEFQELWGNAPDSEGKLLLEFAIRPLEFGKAVANAARAVLQEYGAAGYKERWVEHDFPIRQFELLTELIARWERNGG